MYQNAAILAVFAFVYSTLARGVERTPVNGALVFLTFGFVCGPGMLGLLQLDVPAGEMRAIAEFTLALTLFTDAAKADLRVLRRVYQLPWRMLLLGLPLTILLGFLCGLLLMADCGIWELALLAVMLAPTDAALAKVMITHPKVPPQIRETLNVESGLNDGICVPLLYLFLALAAETSAAHSGAGLALEFLVRELGVGLLVGCVLTLAGSWLLRWSARRHWVRGNWQPVHTVALALACYASAQWLGGSGFIAAFGGGLLFGALVTRHKEGLLIAAESAGEVLGMVTWVVFGSVALGYFVDDLTWPMVLYAVLSLTLVRALPVCLCLLGTGLDWPSRLFIGWFGPRGLATIVFGAIVMGAELPHTRELGATVMCTVVMSVMLHGLTANPLASLYGRYEARRARSSPGVGHGRHR